MNQALTKQEQERTALIHRAFLVRGLLLENKSRGVDKISLDTSMTRQDISTLLMDFIHYNQYLTVLRITIESNRKAYRKALKKNNKKNASQIQQFKEAQQWIDEALDPAIGTMYEDAMHQLLVLKVLTSSCEKPDFVQLSMNEKMGVVFHTCLDIVQRQWTNCGIITPVVKYEEEGKEEEEEEPKEKLGEEKEGSSHVGK